MWITIKSGGKKVSYPLGAEGRGKQKKTQQPIFHVIAVNLTPFCRFLVKTHSRGDGSVQVQFSSFSFPVYKSQPSFPSNKKGISLHDESPRFLSSLKVLCFRNCDVGAGGGGVGAEGLPLSTASTPPHPCGRRG